MRFLKEVDVAGSKVIASCILVSLLSFSGYASDSDDQLIVEISNNQISEIVDNHIGQRIKAFSMTKLGIGGIVFLLGTIGHTATQTAYTCGGNFENCFFAAMDGAVSLVVAGIGSFFAISDVYAQNRDSWHAKNLRAFLDDAHDIDNNAEGPIKECVAEFNKRNPRTTTSYKDIAEKILAAHKALYFVQADAFRGMTLPPIYDKCEDIPSTEILCGNNMGVFAEASLTEIIRGLVNDYPLSTIESDREENIQKVARYYKRITEYDALCRKNSPDFFGAL